MKLYNCAAITAAATIVALLFVVAAAEEEGTPAESTTTISSTVEAEKLQPVSEQPIKRVHVLNPGEREYLSPNLIGLQNIAMTYLPLSLNFVNVIDAFREIVNGVRYEIVLNAQDREANDKDLVCRLVILEKPWIRTEWGDKYRELQNSNCTRDVAAVAAGVQDSEASASNNIDSSIMERSKVLNDKYSQQGVYNGNTRNELNTAEMHKLEAQIISVNPTTTETPTTVVIPIDADAMGSIEMETTTLPPELTDNEKKWLDDFLSVGALNFEQMLREKAEQQAAESATIATENINDNQEQQLLAVYNNDQLEAYAATETNVEQQQQQTEQRVKRSSKLVGGASPLDVQEAEDRLKPMLDKLAAGEKAPCYKIKKVHSASTQVVSGTLTKINADLVSCAGEEENCIVAIWSQPWLKNGHEISLDCPNKALIKQRLSRSTEHLEKKHSHKKHKLHSLDKIEHLFHKFQMKFKRHYVSAVEKQMRLRIFKQNIKTIQELNRNELGSAKYGITEFADMTSTEYKMRTGLWEREPQRASKNQIAHIPNVELPKEFDWREKGAVSEVKNQGNCGSCWAFSVTGNIEGIHAVKTGVLEEYSEQELLDCDTVDSACNGGLPDNAYEAIQKIGGLELESEYPYKAHKNQCHFNKSMAHIKVTGHVDLPKNETAMAQWLLVNGPISIGINANAMQFYRGGVSHPWKALCSTKNLDHGVLIVGYGVSEYPNFKKVLPYWIVKNSWGPRWGEQGYYRVYRGQNTCGVSEMATSAILAD